MPRDAISEDSEYFMRVNELAGVWRHIGDAFGQKNLYCLWDGVDNGVVVVSFDDEESPYGFYANLGGKGGWRQADMLVSTEWEHVANYSVLPAVTHCAQCHIAIFEMDYLCGGCRV